MNRTPVFNIQPGGGATRSLSQPITGYASVFNVVDAQKDKIMPGAFRESLQTLNEQRRYPPLLWQHDQQQPIGVITRLREDQKGLAVQFQLLPEVQRGHEALSLVKARAVDGLSIGFKVRSAIKRKGYRLITKVELWEVSLVTFPANSAARIH